MAIGKAADLSPARVQALKDGCVDNLTDHPHTPSSSDHTVCLVCQLRRDSLETLAALEVQGQELDAVRKVLDPLDAAPTIALDVLACALKQQVEAQGQTIARLTVERDAARSQFDRHVEWTADETDKDGRDAEIDRQAATIARLEQEKAEARETINKLRDAIEGEADGKTWSNFDLEALIVEAVMHRHAGMQLDRAESALAAKDAELARLTAERTWRPIETAPIDRRVIVNASDGPCEAYLNGTPMRWVTSHGTPIRPTRWMQFPSDPPVAADAPKETT